MPGSAMTLYVYILASKPPGTLYVARAVRDDRNA
jgi:hypothetical protein